MLEHLREFTWANLRGKMLLSLSLSPALPFDHGDPALWNFRSKIRKFPARNLQPASSIHANPLGSFRVLFRSLASRARAFQVNPILTGDSWFPN